MPAAATTTRKRAREADVDDDAGPPDAAAVSVREPAEHFGLGWERLRTFARLNTRGVADLGFFDARQPARFVVVSVDPAGGGLLSEEAFLVFLVCDNRFGLLTGRMVPGHTQRYGFSMVPLVFVLSLLHTVRAVRTLLQRLHDERRPPAEPPTHGPRTRARARTAGTAAEDPGDFVMPPVLVLIENNYAYGAAIYMQMLWFLDGGPAPHVHPRAAPRRPQQRQQRSPDLADVDIVFATPVYGLDQQLLARYAELSALHTQLRTMAERHTAARAAVRDAWLERRRRGMNLALFLQTMNGVLQQEARDTGAPHPTTLDAREADAATAADVLGRMIGEAVDDGDERAEVLRAWAAAGGSMAQSVAAQMAVRRHQAAVQARARAVQADIDAHLGRHTDEVNRGHHDFVRLARLPPRHTLDAAPPHGIRVEPNGLWDGGKRLVGEWTQEAQKVLAYRHFVSVALQARPSPYFSVLTTTAAAARPAAGPVPPPCGPELRTPDHEGRALVDGRRVLECVYHQWRHLAVWVHPDHPLRPVRVVGKQPAVSTGDPRDGAVHKDDLWMSFSIGLQWCTRFTQLLPSAAHRIALVDYMRQLRQTMERALLVTLRDADGDPEPAVANPQPAAAPPPGAPGAPVPAPPRTPPPTGAERDALVVCTALASANLRVCTACVVLVRRLVLAYAVHHHPPSAGWRLVFTERAVPQGGPGGGSQRFWNEALNRELLATGQGVRVDDVRRAFALPVRTVRLVCSTAPGPRYAWPGLALPRDAHQPPPRDRRPPTDPTDVVAALRRLVAALRAAVGRCEDLHAEHHPVLATPETRHLLSLMLQRAAGQVDDLDALLRLRQPSPAPAAAADAGPPSVVPVVVRNAAAGDGIPALNRQARAAAAAPPPGGGRASPTPHILFLMYGQLADDARFLRRLVDHGRERLLTLAPADAAPRRPALACAECAVGGLPTVSLRITGRELVNYRRAFRTLFPARYQAVHAAAEAEAASRPRVTVVQSRLLFGS